MTIWGWIKATLVRIVAKRLRMLRPEASAVAVPHGRAPAELLEEARKVSGRTTAALGEVLKVQVILGAALATLIATNHATGDWVALVGLVLLAFSFGFSALCLLALPSDLSWDSRYPIEEILAKARKATIRGRFVLSGAVLSTFASIGPIAEIAWRAV